MLRYRNRHEVLSSCGQAGPSSNQRFGFSALFYFDAYGSYRSSVQASDYLSHDPETDTFDLRALMPERRARVKLAIASKGPESLPFVLEMLRSTDPEESQDAKDVLALMGGDIQVTDSLVESIATATDLDTVTALVTALGATRNTRSVPYLARILRAPGIDDGTMRAAVASLGQLINRPLGDTVDPFVAAVTWLAENGYESVPVVEASPPENPVPGGLVHVQTHTSRHAEHRRVSRASAEEVKE